MLIKIDNEFKKFDRIIKKKAMCLEVLFDNCQIRCSMDHLFKLPNGLEVKAANLQSGDKVLNTDLGVSTFIFADFLGEQEVYTPLNVEGEYYNTTNGLVHHNCSFLGSSRTLIGAEALEGLRQKEPIRYDKGFKLKIFEEPIPGVLYVMGVDSSTGVTGDYSCIQVMKVISRQEMHQVAVYRDNEISPENLAVVVKQLSDMYNECYYIIENQDTGHKVCEELYYELENYKLISTDGPGKPLGTRATKRSKLDACMELKRLMDNGFLEVVDADTIAELSRFEELDVTNVFKGAKGTHDDTVSGLYWACYCTMQPEIDLDDCKATIAEPVVDYPADYMMIHPEGTSSSDFWSDF